MTQQNQTSSRSTGRNSDLNRNIDLLWEKISGANASEHISGSLGYGIEDAFIREGFKKTGCNISSGEIVFTFDLKHLEIEGAICAVQTASPLAVQLVFSPRDETSLDSFVAKLTKLAPKFQFEVVRGEDLNVGGPLPCDSEASCLEALRQILHAATR